MGVTGSAVSLVALVGQRSRGLVVCKGSYGGEGREEREELYRPVMSDEIVIMQSLLHDGGYQGSLVGTVCCTGGTRGVTALRPTLWRLH